MNEWLAYMCIWVVCVDDNYNFLQLIRLPCCYKLLSSRSQIQLLGSQPLSLNPLPSTVYKYTQSR